LSRNPLQMHTELIRLICASNVGASQKQIHKNFVPVNRPTAPRQPGIRRN